MVEKVIKELWWEGDDLHVVTEGGEKQVYKKAWLKDCTWELSKSDTKTVLIEKVKNIVYEILKQDESYAEMVRLNQEMGLYDKKECPPHRWDADGERCKICGIKDWMT